MLPLQYGADMGWVDRTSWAEMSMGTGSSAYDEADNIERMRNAKIASAAGLIAR
jgi:hypothetical protein